MKVKMIFFVLIMVSISRTSPAQKIVADTAYLSHVKAELRAVWPSNRTINLVFHGHSVPAGYWHNHEVHTLESYPNLVLEKLKEKYPYAPINIIVTAIGGENSQQGEARFIKDVLSHKPDVLFIDYALNDRSLGLEKAKQAWEKMIQEATRQHIKLILLTPSPDQRVDITAEGNELERHTTQIRQLAQTYKTGIVDSFLLFQEKIKAGEKLADYMSHVNHPNKRGHEMIAEEIMKWF